MEFTTQAIADKDPMGTKDKIIVGTDAYAVATMLERLIAKMEQARIS